MQKTRARISAPVLLVALALPLAGCETTSDPLATVITSPGRYSLYDCPAIKVEARSTRVRQHELEGLMARADRGPAGGLINATTYQPEYVTLRGKMDQLRRMAATNNCGFDPATVPLVEAQAPSNRQAPPPPKRRVNRPSESR